MPFTLPQRWPFCWWVAAALDHFSRFIVAHAVFRHEPDAAEVQGLLDRAVGFAGRAPKYTVTDQGSQFRRRYRRWCRAHGVRPRFGAVGKCGSIAVIERFWRSLKQECLRLIAVPFGRAAMEAEVVAYLSWYNGSRPHQSLGGATPLERLTGARPAGVRPGIVTRARYPLAAPKGRGPPRRRARRPMDLVIAHEPGRPHLPIVSLRPAA